VRLDVEGALAKAATGEVLLTVGCASTDRPTSNRQTRTSAADRPSRHTTPDNSLLYIFVKVCRDKRERKKAKQGGPATEPAHRTIIPTHSTLRLNQCDKRLCARSAMLVMNASRAIDSVASYAFAMSWDFLFTYTTSGNLTDSTSVTNSTQSRPSTIGEFR